MTNPRRSAKTTLCAASLSVALYAAGAGATTIVAGGTISTQTWTAAGSPYQLQGDVTVPSAGTLTIASGEVVQFASSDALASGVDPARVELNAVGALIEVLPRAVLGSR